MTEKTPHILVSIDKRRKWVRISHHDDKIIPAGQAVFQKTITLTQKPLRPISPDCALYSAISGESHAVDVRGNRSRVMANTLRSPKKMYNDIPSRKRLPAFIYTRKFIIEPKRLRALFRHYSDSRVLKNKDPGKVSSSRQTFSSLESSSLENVSPAGRAHSFHKAVLFGSVSFLGLICHLHVVGSSESLYHRKVRRLRTALELYKATSTSVNRKRTIRPYVCELSGLFDRFA